MSYGVPAVYGGASVLSGMALVGVAAEDNNMAEPALLGGGSLRSPPLKCSSCRVTEGERGLGTLSMTG
jgi:hypothetical protein